MHEIPTSEFSERCDDRGRQDSRESVNGFGKLVQDDEAVVEKVQFAPRDIMTMHVTPGNALLQKKNLISAGGMA
jgi:hypothetical protein